MDIDPLFILRAALFSSLIASIAVYLIANWGRNAESDGFFR